MLPGICRELRWAEIKQNMNWIDAGKIMIVRTHGQIRLTSLPRPNKTSAALFHIANTMMTVTKTPPA